MGRTACTEPQCLYKGALYLYLILPPFVNIYKWNSNQTFNNASVGSQHEMRIFYDVVGG
jgi:hypothetical protein